MHWCQTLCGNNSSPATHSARAEFEPWDREVDCGRDTSQDPQHQTADYQLRPRELARFIRVLKGKRDGQEACIFAEGRCDNVRRAAGSNDGLWVVLPTAHPLTKAMIISLAEVARYPLILPRDETDLEARQRIEAFLEDFDPPHIAFRTGSIGTMLTLVSLGHGIGLLGFSQVPWDSRSGVALRRLDGAIELAKRSQVLNTSSRFSAWLGQMIGLARGVLDAIRTAKDGGV